MDTATFHKLSRILVTGNVNICTPLCVLLEIAEAHGIVHNHSVSKLVHEINERPIVRVNFDEKITITDLQLVARFVNSHCNWTKRTLKQAFDFLIQFNKEKIEIPTNFEIGLQTSQQPFLINACVLYKMCTVNGIEVKPTTTINQMAYAIKLLKSSAETISRRMKLFLETATTSQMISLLITSENEFEDAEILEPTEIPTIGDFNIIPKEKLSSTRLLSNFEYYTSLRSMQRDAISTSVHDSVTLLALTDKFDISKASNPVFELKEFRSKTRDSYIPVDSWMKHWFEINPKLFNLTVTFNPLFPREFYREEDLSKMVIAEGHNLNLLEDSYEILQLAHLSNTFYYGLMPGLKSEFTIIDRDLIAEVPCGQLLCYGQKDSGLNLISIEELINLFESNKNFTSPFGCDEVFSKEAINKLKIITRSTEGPGSNHLSMETIQLKIRLLNVINRTTATMKIFDKMTSSFIAKYSDSDDSFKEIIVSALTSLLNIGMYTRGWTGKGDYPLNDNYVKLPHEQIETNTSSEIFKFESFSEIIGDLITGLPLVIFKAGEYLTSNSEDEGLTIGERLTIMKEGDKSDTINSCMRLSSNWLCSSAHKYLSVLGNSEPFNIYTLKHIA